VVEPYPSEKYAKVSWDDDIPNMMGKIWFMVDISIPMGVSWDYILFHSQYMESHKIPWFQSPPTSD